MLFQSSWKSANFHSCSGKICSLTVLINKWVVVTERQWKIKKWEKVNGGARQERMSYIRLLTMEEECFGNITHASWWRYLNHHIEITCWLTLSYLSHICVHGYREEVKKSDLCHSSGHRSNSKFITQRCQRITTVSTHLLGFLDESWNLWLIQ